MAKRAFATQGVSFVATAQGAQTNNNYMALYGGSATQTIDLLEVLISGMATSSIVTSMGVRRTATPNFATAAALVIPNTDGPMHPATAALTAAPAVFISATTPPTTSTTITDAALNLALNAFGGIIRWNAAPTQQWTILGNTFPFAAVLQNGTGGGASTATMNAHFIYEPY